MPFACIFRPQNQGNYQPASRRSAAREREKNSVNFTSRVFSGANNVFRVRVKTERVIYGRRGCFSGGKLASNLFFKGLSRERGDAAAERGKREEKYVLPRLDFYPGKCGGKVAELGIFLVCENIGMTNIRVLLWRIKITNTKCLVNCQSNIRNTL